MKFEKFLNNLREKTFEEVVKDITNIVDVTDVQVECNKNEVYVNNNLHRFLENLNAKIADYGAGYALIVSDNEKYYELPYREIENRINSDLPNETVLIFDINKIYDVTDDYQ